MIKGPGDRKDNDWPQQEENLLTGPMEQAVASGSGQGRGRTMRRERRMPGPGSIS